MAEDRPRLVPERAFPPYAYAGGGHGHPHPRNHPDGHSHGEPEIKPPRLEPAAWWKSEAYLFGLDLFNHGYHWEAHEEWEGLWNAAGRRGPVSEFMKGLIKLGAAGVKARQGQAEGVRRHGERAREHFRLTRETVGEERFAGFSFAELDAFTAQTMERAVELSESSCPLVFDEALIPCRK